MNVIYSNQKIPTYLGNSIFLAGPTPRSKDVLSWRPEALRILEEIGFTGTVFVPEYSDNSVFEGYDHQVEWEEEGLNRATCITFWIPRNLETMPAFTTNIEWGTWHKSAKVVVGAPPNTPKMRYIQYYAKKHGVPYAESLESTLRNALKCINYYNRATNVRPRRG